MNEYDGMLERARDLGPNDPLPPGTEEPVDVVQVRADEALIAAMSASDQAQINDPIDERLAQLLVAWRDDARTDSDRPLIDLDKAAAAIAAAPVTPTPAKWAAGGGRVGPFGPLATVAAVLVVAFIGLGLAARGAEPGDALWTVSKVLYSDRAKSVQAKITVAKKLDEASEALASNNKGAALIAIEEAEKELRVVAEADGKEQLENRADELKVRAGAGSDPPTTSSEATSASTSATSAPPTTTEPPTTTPTAPTTTTEPVLPAPAPTTTPEPSIPATTAAPEPEAEAPASEPAEEAVSDPKAGDGESQPSESAPSTTT